MKKFILLFLLASFLTGYAQRKTDKVNTKWGMDLKMTKGFNLSDYVGSDENGFYVMASIQRGMNRKEYLVQKYNNDLEKVKSLAIRFVGKEKKFQAKGVIFFNDELYVIAFHLDKKTKKGIYYAIPIDKSTFTMTSKRINLGESSFDKVRSAGNFSFLVSKENKSLALIFESPYQKDEPKVTTYRVYDENLELKYEKEFSSDIIGNDEYFRNSITRLDEEGNIFMSGFSSQTPNIVYTGFFNRRNKDIDLEFEPKDYIISIFGEDDPIITDISQKDLNINEFQFKSKDDGNIICSGFYSGDEDYTVKGVFFFEIDIANGRTSNFNKKEFSEDFVTQYWTHKEKKKAKKEKIKKNVSPALFNYDLDDIIIRDNGEVILIAEQSYVRITTTTTTDANGNTTTRTTYHYYYKDILAINFKPNGDFNWMTKVPKRQYSVNDGGFYSSYFLIDYNNTLYFFYNDTPKNLFNPNDDEVNWYKGRDGICALATIDKNGELEREAVFDNSDEKIVAIPRLADQLDKDEVLLFCKFRRKSKFAKLTIK